MIFDSGASCSAFPREVGEGYGIVKDEHAGYEYHGAGSENSAIKDGTRAHALDAVCLILPLTVEKECDTFHCKN